MAKKVIKDREIVEEPQTTVERREVEVAGEPMTETKIYDRLVAASCKTLVGSEVINPQGDKLGKIEDIMIDTEEKSIAYAILKTGSFLGLGGKLLPIPLQAFRIQSPPGSKEAEFVLNTPKETLEKAEGYDADQMPRRVDYKRLGEVYSDFGHEPYWGHEKKSQ